MKVIVFTGESGRYVIYGEIDGTELPNPGDVACIKNARKILRVESVGFVGLAGKGPLPGTGTRITGRVPQTEKIVKQVLECTPEAAEKIEAWPEWPWPLQ